MCNRGEDMDIKIKKVRENAIIPTRGSEQAAGYDLYACIDSPIEIEAHCTVKINTGICIEIPHGYFGAIFPRSGIASKQGLRMANCVAVIDEDYRGEWILPIHNDGHIIKTINPKDRVAQLVVLPYKEINFLEVSELSETDRGDGGFGSTGR